MSIYGSAWITAIIFSMGIATSVIAQNPFPEALDFFPCDTSSGTFLPENVGMRTFVTVENFRGIPDAEWGDNYGLNIGVTTAFPIPIWREDGIGMQAGVSYGAYDFAGRGFGYKHNREIQSQTFLSIGFFKQMTVCSPWSIGLVCDWMFNKNYGVYAESPSLFQWRGQSAWMFSPQDEVGFWMTYSDTTSHKRHTYHIYTHEISFRPISQLNFFWRHLFCSGVTTNLWAGIPYHERLAYRLSRFPAKFFLGGEIVAPLEEQWQLLARASYAHPDTKRGYQGNKEYGCNIAIELAWNFGYNGISQAWSPYLPLANNSNFLVDARSRIK